MIKVKLTKKLIHLAATEKGGWNKEQLAILGINWPPYKGWLVDMIGKEISLADYEKFIELKNK